MNSECSSAMIMFDVFVFFQLMATQLVMKQPVTSLKTPGEIKGRELLGRMGRSASPATAFNLCVQLGLMRQHENLFAREAGIHKVSQSLFIKAFAERAKDPFRERVSLKRDLLFEM